MLTRQKQSGNRKLLTCSQVVLLVPPLLLRQLDGFCLFSQRGQNLRYSEIEMDNSHLNFIFQGDWVPGCKWNCVAIAMLIIPLQTLMIWFFYIHHIALLIHEDSWSMKCVWCQFKFKILTICGVFLQSVMSIFLLKRWPEYFLHHWSKDINTSSPTTVGNCVVVLCFLGKLLGSGILHWSQNEK